MKAHPQIPTRTPLTDAPIDPATMRHNAYVAGFQDAATDSFSWEQYGAGRELGGQDYLDGFEAGKAVRKMAFIEARRRAGRGRSKDDLDGDPVAVVVRPLRAQDTRPWTINALILTEGGLKRCLVRHLEGGHHAGWHVCSERDPKGEHRAELVGLYAMPESWDGP